MRLNEICQLYVSDIIKFDDLWCISINAEKDNLCHRGVVGPGILLVDVCYMIVAGTGLFRGYTDWPTLSKRIRCN
jgi:hypothetical protein